MLNLVDDNIRKSTSKGDMKKKIFLAVAAVFLGMMALVLRPVPIVYEHEAKVEKGVVSTVFEGTDKDIYIQLKNNSTLYYINRGMEKGLSITELRRKLLDKEVVLKYPRHWTPLDWNQKVKHLSKVEVNGAVIFNELK